MKITELEVALYAVPLPEVVYDSMHGIHTHFDVVTVTLTNELGQKGTGYTYTGGRGGHSIATMIHKDMRRYIEGFEAQVPTALCKMLDKTFHYVGRGGVLSFAISAVDIAMWDLHLKVLGMPLHAIYGKKAEPVKTYYGGIDLGYDEPKLLASIEKALSNGHTGVKIKVGKEDWREDVHRIRQVRKLLGDDYGFMIDANMVWSKEHALMMCQTVADQNLIWIEEPMNPDDILGYQALAEVCPIPIAMGENLHTFFEHKNAIEIGKVSYLQPDASNICGITGWLEVAQMAKEHTVSINPHGMQELHVNLMAAIDNAGVMEFHSFPIYQYIQEPLDVCEGLIMPSTNAGIGVNFDQSKIGPYRQ